jgi:hypothetical protein
MPVLEEARKNIPETDGIKDFEKFLTIANLYNNKVRHEYQKPDFALCILTKLTGRAYDIANSVNPPTWPTIETALRNAFTEKISVTTLHTQLANCCQKESESAFDFSLRIQKLLAQLKKGYTAIDAQNNFFGTEGPAISAFEEGLLDNNARILIKSKATTFAEAVELASLEESRKMNKLMKTNIVKQECSFCQSDSHILSECVKFKKQNFLCKICYKVGHFPADCNNSPRASQNQNNYNRNKPIPNYRNNFQTAFPRNYNLQNYSPNNYPNHYTQPNQYVSNVPFQRQINRNPNYNNNYNYDYQQNYQRNRQDNFNTQQQNLRRVNPARPGNRQNLETPVTSRVNH